MNRKEQLCIPKIQSRSPFALPAAMTDYVRRAHPDFGAMNEPVQFPEIQDGSPMPSWYDFYCPWDHIPTIWHAPRGMNGTLRTALPSPG